MPLPRLVRLIALVFLAALAPLGQLAAADPATPVATPGAQGVVTGSTTPLADAQRSSRWPDGGPQGNVGIAGSVAFDYPAYSPAEAVADGLVIGTWLGTSSGLAGRDAADGTRVWTFDPEKGNDTTYLALWNDTIYDTFEDGSVTAISARTGAVQWQSQALPKGMKAYGAVAVADDRVYAVFGSYASAFDATTGARLWTRNLMQDSGADSSDYVALLLTIANGRLIVPLVPRGDSSAPVDTYALDVTSGVVAWRHSGPEAFFSADQDHLYGYGSLHSPSPPLTAIDATSGSVIWSSQIVPQFAPAISAQGTPIVVSTDVETESAVVQAVDASGAVRWTQRLPEGFGRAEGPPGVAGELVIVPQASGVTAFDAESGTQAWQVALPCKDMGVLLGVTDGRVFLTEAKGWIVLGGNSGPNATAIHPLSAPPVSQNSTVTLSKAATLVDHASANAFPVADLKSGTQLTVTGPSVSAEGKTWWPVSDDSGDNGYLPEDAFTVTSCPTP